MEIILKYFPNLSDKQKEQFSALFDLYVNWNSQINVISRKDIENLYCHHILHSLSIAKIVNFTDGTKILDIGTGGGFPGVPLAIFFPNCEFTLIDSIGKKIKVATEVSNAIGLTNITCKHLRGQEEKGIYDFVVSRAVMPLGDLVKIIRKNVSKKDQKNSIPNGLICLKGGELESEVEAFKKHVIIDDLSSFFEEDFFETKKAVYLPL